MRLLGESLKQSVEEAQSHLKSYGDLRWQNEKMGQQWTKTTHHSFVSIELFCAFLPLLKFSDIIRRGVITMAPGLSPGVYVTQPEITKST